MVLAHAKTILARVKMTFASAKMVLACAEMKFADAKMISARAKMKFADAEMVFARVKMTFAYAEMIKTAHLWQKRGLPGQQPRRQEQKRCYPCPMRRLLPDKMPDLGRELAWREGKLAESVDKVPF